MNLSSLSDTLRSRFANLGLLAARQPEATRATAAVAPASNPDTKVQLGVSEDSPTLYDRFGQLNGNDAASVRQHARDKVAELKKRIKWLKSMMVGASPAQHKVLARQLGQIASELKSAVKNFTNASSSGTPAPATGLGQAAVNVSSSADADAQTSPVSNQAGSAEADLPAANTPADAAQDSSAQDSAQASTSSDPQDSNDASNKEKQDFIRDAKELASDIKRTLEAIKRKLRRQGGEMVRQVESTLRDIGKMLDALGSSGGNLASVGNTLATASVQVTAAVGGNVGVSIPQAGAGTVAG